MRITVMMLGMLGLALLLGACGDDLPPTEIVVVSSTPEMVTPVTPGGETAISPSITAAPSSEPSANPQPTPGPILYPGATPLPTATPRPDIFPTDMVASLPIAEQVFEHGRMFWIRDRRMIWVMQASPDDPNGGDWFCYNDTFEEGEPEIDPTLIPPESLFQPRRGFGKLWRNHPEFREALGWGLTPEFELTSSYRYIAGGTVSDGQYVVGPGEHRLTTLYNESISFYEGDIRGDCRGGTWHMTP